MRIVILTAGSRGDVQPYVGLGVGLQRAGHQVCLPAPEAFRSLITEAGPEFVPVKGLDPQELLRLPEVQALVRKSGRPTTMLAMLRIGQRYLADLLDEYWRSSEGADLLVASTAAYPLFRPCKSCTYDLNLGRILGAGTTQPSCVL